MRAVFAIAAVSLLLILGLALQAHWDNSCGQGNRWDAEKWRCVEYNG